MAIKKRGFQSPWLHMILGAVAGTAKNLEKERERQEEYARKAALMNQEQAYRASEKSQEQTLADTRLKEQRAYNEGQTKESRAYAATLNAQKEEEDRQRSIQENDPTRQIASAFSPSPWSGEAGFPGGSAGESALAKEMGRIAKIHKAAERLEAIERFNPKNAEGQAAYINGVFYEALTSMREVAQAELKKDSGKQAAIDRVNGMLLRGPEPGKADEWFREASAALSGALGSPEYDDLSLALRTAATAYRTQEKTDSTAEARVSPEERIARDVGPAVVKSGLNADPDADPTELLRRANVGVSTSRIAAGVGSEADSLLTGAKQRAGAMPGVAGPTTKQAAQLLVQSGKFKTEQEAIDNMAANGVDISK